MRHPGTHAITVTSLFKIIADTHCACFTTHFSQQSTLTTYHHKAGKDIYILTHICIRIHMHTNTHAHTWHCPHAEALILRPTIYAQICIHIHIHMYINAYIYIYIHTCIYIHTYMSAHTYTYIHKYIQKVHMHARKHTWNDSTAANVRGADPDAGSSARLFRSTQWTTFSTSNARTSLYPLPETPIPLNLPSPLPNIPQNSLQTTYLWRTWFYCSTLINTTQWWWWLLLLLSKVV